VLTAATVTLTLVEAVFNSNIVGGFVTKDSQGNNSQSEIFEFKVE